MSISPRTVRYILLRRVRAGVEALVAADHVRELAGEKAHEVIPRAALQIEDVRADESGAVVGHRLYRRFELRPSAW